MGSSICRCLSVLLCGCTGKLYNLTGEFLCVHVCLPWLQRKLEVTNRVLDMALPGLPNQGRRTYLWADGVSGRYRNKRVSQEMNTGRTELTSQDESWP